MKRLLSLMLTLVLLTSTMLTHSAFAATSGKQYVLPASLTAIEEEAFAGNNTLGTVVIPKTVTRIGTRAFADCTGLTEIYFGKNQQIVIDDSAFEGCGDIHFYVFPDTAAELFALSHGYECDVMEEDSTFLQRAISLVTASGGSSSMLQSGEFAAKRLIVEMNGTRLIDISEYHPTRIIRSDEGIFIIQFNTVPDTMNCYNYLKNIEKENSSVIFVEPDVCEEVIDDIEAAGYVYSRIWDTDDPMGFDAYSAFVSTHSSKRATIAVIDSGVEKKAAYQSRLRSDGISLASDSTDWTVDSMRHGSVIVGIINDCVGDANVDVLPVRVVGANGVASVTMIAMGIQYAMEHGADVINLSLKCDENKYISYWIDKALLAGIKVIVAAGNSSRDIAKVFPANVPGVITVSGIDSDYELSAISNFGENISYCAPDTDVVCSAYNGTRTGTSFAAPMVAAAFALLKLDIYHNEEDLRATCRQLTNSVGDHNNYGYGLMQLGKIARIDVDSVSFDDAIDKKMARGETQELAWVVLPDNATDQSVSFESSNTNVLKITTANNVTTVNAEGKGRASITVKANNTGSEKHPSDTIEIDVVQPVQSLTVSVPKTRLALGKSMKASVTAVIPDDADEKGYDWKVRSQGGKATIAPDGTITATGTGKVSVYAVAKDGYDAQSNMVDIDIVDIPDAESVVITEKNGLDVSRGSIRVDPGTSLSLQAEVLPEDADQQVTWSCKSTPEGAVSVNSKGVVSISAAGVADITATTENGISATLTVEASILPVEIMLSGAQTIDVGKTSQLTVGYTPVNTTARDIIWTSTSPSVAKVNSNGVVTGVSKGTASIVAISAVNSTVSAALTITVRQPYTLAFDANGGSVSMTSMTAYSGYAIGELPTSSKRDYYDFAGWWTAADGGTQVTASTVLNRSEPFTVYAHWNLHPLSDWVLASAAPADARIEDRKSEATESTASTMSGWMADGNYWKQTGSGSIEYASKPDGVRGQWPDSNMADGPLSAYDNGSTKRDVSNNWAGYVYWHWMYDCGYSNGTDNRSIFNSYAYGPVSRYLYKYFGAFTSTESFTYGGNMYCENLYWDNWINYNRRSWEECQGNLRWFRYDYYRSYYTDYQKIYKYKRDLVRYRAK